MNATPPAARPPCARKAELRGLARGRRRAAQRRFPQAGAGLVERLRAEPRLAKPQIVGGYAAQGSEMDAFPAMEHYAAQGARLAMPLVLDDGGMDFVAWDGIAPLKKIKKEGAFNVPQPADTRERVSPDLILVPLLAFDDAGMRLGQGGGYYDRYLAGASCLAIGLAFTEQRFARLPAEPHDIVLDAICTPAALVWTKKKKQQR